MISHRPEAKVEIINAAMNAAAIVERPDIRMNGTEGLDPSLAGGPGGGMICDQGDRSDVGPGAIQGWFNLSSRFPEVTCWP